MNPSMESLAATAAMEQQQEQAAAVAAAYYGYEKIEGSSVENGRPCTELVPSNGLATTTTTAAEGSSNNGLSSDSFHGMFQSPQQEQQDQSSAMMFPTQNNNNNSIEVPGSPLPADRLARKQRNFPRRGGFCHSALLKSAVMANIEDASSNHNSSSNGLTASPGSVMLHNGVVAPNSNSSPRKRMRRSDHAIMAPMVSGSDTAESDTHNHNQGNSHHSRLSRQSSHSPHNNTPGNNNNNTSNSAQATDEAVIARATDLLQRLCVQPLDSRSGHSRRGSPGSRRNGNDLSNHLERKAPVRRVSRRTSYQSQISTGTDYDELDDDEFH